MINAQRKRHAHRTALLVLMTFAAGCVLPQSSNLAPPQPAKVAARQDALVERVVLLDERIPNPDVTEEALTTNFADLLTQAGYFQRVKVVPEKISQGYIVRLRFERYELTRRIHPIYFPAAFLTATFYIWFNGPIYRDVVDMKADLKIESADGKTLATQSEEVKYTENIGLYSEKREAMDGAAERTKLIQSLVDGAMAQLHTAGGT